MQQSWIRIVMTSKYSIMQVYFYVTFWLRWDISGLRRARRHIGGKRVKNLCARGLLHVCAHAHNVRGKCISIVHRFSALCIAFLSHIQKFHLYVQHDIRTRACAIFYRDRRHVAIKAPRCVSRSFFYLP